jgi:hypothetical protein
MVKIRRGDDIILGLTAEEIWAIMKGGVISLNLKECEYNDVNVSIYAGMNEKAMMEDFINKKGPTTKMK